MNSQVTATSIYVSNVLHWSMLFSVVDIDCSGLCHSSV